MATGRRDVLPGRHLLFGLQVMGAFLRKRLLVRRGQPFRLLYRLPQIYQLLVLGCLVAQ